MAGNVMDNSSPHSADDPQATPALPPRWSWLLRLTLIVLATGTAWGAYAWYCSRSANAPNPPPPRSTRFLNTRPGVAYVGSQRCGECHAAEAATYAEHPMGRSVSPAGRGLSAQRKAAPSFTASGLFYAVQREGEKIWHLETLDHGDIAVQGAVALRAEAAYAIGSGRQGQSFVVNRDGRYFQSPISWYVHDTAWNLSPGFEKHNRHFSRTITEECLFCHSNEAHVQTDTINRFESKSSPLQPIGCERCHGPGELHVAAHENGGTGGGDHTIVNPRRLTPQLREAVCEQCHLQGEARIVHEGASLWGFRPGLSLDRFVSVFVPPPTGAGSRKAVSHVEQMHQSRCFQASGGKMGCITCHDPHVLPAQGERVSWYRGRCLHCHEESNCSLPVKERHQQSAADSCIDCHMPRGTSSNIAHTSITDHRIVRHAARDGKDEDAGFRLVRFHSGMWDDGDADARRDLGLALAELAERTDVETGRRLLSRQAHLLLTPAVESHPGDVAAWEARGQALWRDKRPREALDSLDKALQRAPRRELALQTAALVALELNETERSIAYWDRLLDIDPYTWESHAYRGQALALRRQWAEAVDACGAALRLNPFEAPTRMLRIDCLIRLGQRRQARDELETLLALPSAKPEQIRKWFEELMNAGR